MGKNGDDVAELAKLELGRADEALRIDLLWEVPRPFAGTTVFVHVVDASGQLLTQADGDPVGGSYPFDIWAVGPGGVIRNTTNGGVNWQPQTSGTFNALLDVDFASTSTGWAVGTGGIILHTTDGGSTWLGQVSGASNDLRDIYALNTTTAWAVGGNSSAAPQLILKTTDGGATWTTLSNGKNGWLNAIYFVDALNGWAGDFDGSIYATQNGGTTWVQQSSSVSDPLEIRAFSFVNTTIGWAAGGGTGAILKTTSGGFGP